MTEYRIDEHPILPVRPQEGVEFYWKGRKLSARRVR